ncbi:hypothetical protein CBR_g31947 [Chara braunii]|uniref:Isomerase n=1 Tax=Chara braunii TaxID=69332 RepID=A0A388LGC1_CHABU|nr:hypothetical protein CBR_g31947 [Chara braunii]|eukprot:GBG81273.1 hypothetical protein CBR_g31947 [Chara braunii]
MAAAIWRVPTAASVALAGRSGGNGVAEVGLSSTSRLNSTWHLTSRQSSVVLQARKRRNGSRSTKASVEQWAEQPSRQQVIHEAIQRLSEDDIQATAAKYKIEDELFSEIDYAQVNAFTDRAFGGNPAAVCYLPYSGSDRWMQLVAREFNLSETAFLVRRRRKKPPRQPLIVLRETTSDDSQLAGNSTEAREGQSTGPHASPGAADVSEGEDAAADTPRPRRPFEKTPAPDNEFDLRWFTPTIEVDLCGHATLAAAQLVFSAGLVEEEEIKFHTRSGVLTARKVPSTEKSEEDEGAADSTGHGDPSSTAVRQNDTSTSVSSRPEYKGQIELDFPIVRAEAAVGEEGTSLRTALGQALKGRQQSDLKMHFVGRSTGNDILVELESEADVRNLMPDMAKVAAIDARGIIATAATVGKDSEFDFVSRFFAPRSGIPEDPVTGSAHCTSGPFWASKLGKSTMTAYQCSERGGLVHVCVDENKGRVFLRGRAVMVMAGVLLNTHSA